jgi:hypothetical protein
LSIASNARPGTRPTLTTARKPGFVGKHCSNPKGYVRFVPVTARYKKALRSAGFARSAVSCFTAKSALLHGLQEKL